VSLRRRRLQDPPRMLARTPVVKPRPPVSSNAYCSPTHFLYSCTQHSSVPPC
jgi:hypothetical protein